MGRNLFDVQVEDFGTVNDTAAHVQPDPLVLDHCTFVGITLLAGGTLAANANGGWIVEASNDYVTAGDNGRPASAGNWVNITSLFLPALVAIVAGAPAKQYIQAQIAARAIRVTFTATGGAGAVKAIFNAKDL